jgi:hypothetical protein
MLVTDAWLLVAANPLRLEEWPAPHGTGLRWGPGDPHDDRVGAGACDGSVYDLSSVPSAAQSASGSMYAL